MFFSICVAVTFKIASAIVSAVNCVSVAKTSATGMVVVFDSFCALLRKSRLNSSGPVLFGNGALKKVSLFIFCNKFVLIGVAQI